MKLAIIVDSAIRAASVLQVEEDVARAATGLEGEPKSIENARKGFQALLKSTVGMLGEIPRFSFELELVDCSDKTVLNFVEGFRSAVLAELQNGKYLFEGTDKLVYGHFLSFASNQFMSDLRARVGGIVESKDKTKKEPIKFTQAMAEKLDREFIAKAKSGVAVPVASTVSKPVGAAIRQSPEYIALMAKLRSEGKIL